MSRILKRVPLDFKYEGVWEGYLPNIKSLKSNKEVVNLFPQIKNFDDKGISVCSECSKFFDSCEENASYCLVYNKILRGLWYKEPPVGKGYQLWESTSEGSPISPVFSTLEELCIWSEENATIYGSTKISKDEWYEKLSSKVSYAY